MKKWTLILVVLIVGNNLVGQNSEKEKLDEIILNSNEFTVTYESNGCFHSNTETYKITSSIKNIQLVYNSTYEKLNKQFHITISDLLDLRKIFKQGINKDKGKSFCTTSNRYTVSNEKLTVSFSVSNCQFDKFDDWSKKFHPKKD